MRRRQQITIPIKKMSGYDILLEELSENPLWDDYDLNTVKLTILKNTPPPRIKDVDKAIENLKWYSVVYSNCIEIYDGQQIVIKKDLARILKVSRPTLDKWIKDGFIRPLKIDSTLEVFPLDAVLEQLEKQRKKK